MRAECFQEIAQAIGRTPTQAEAQQFEAGLLGKMRELARSEPKWREMTGQQKLQAAAELAQTDALAHADKVAERRASNLLAQARETKRLLARAKELGGTKAHHKALFERLRQVDDYVSGVRNEILSDLVPAIHAVEPRFFGLMDDPAKVRQFAKAVMDGDTADPSLARAAKVYTEAMERVRVRANAAGADIGKLDYGYLPQPHDSGRIARTGMETWAQSVLPKLDRSRYVDANGNAMGDAEVLDMLRGAWDTIATEGLNQRVPGQRGGGSRASRFDDAHRAIHFKDGDAYSDYMAEFGRGSALQSIHGHAGMMAKTIGMMEEFGANPTSTYRLLKDTVEKSDRLQGGTESFATLDMVWETLNGSTSQPVNAKLARFFQGVRNFTTAAKLQGVMLSAITDAPLQVIVAKSNGIPTGEAMKSLFAGVGGDAKAQAFDLAIGMDEIAGEMARWHQDHLAQGWTAKLAQTTMRATLVQAWTDTLRRGFSLTLSRQLDRMRATDWGSLGEYDKRRLTSGGVTEADWKVWQAAQSQEGMLTKHGIRAIPADKLDAIIGGDVARIRGEAQKQIDQLDQRNRQENEWLAKRDDLFNQAQKDAAEAIERLQVSKLADANASVDEIQTQVELLRTQIELVEAQRGLELEAAGESSADRIRGLIADAANAERVSDLLEGPADRATGQALGRGYTAGKRAGERVGNLKRRIKELEAKASAAERVATRKVGDEAQRLGRRLGEHRKDLQGFIERSTDRVNARQAVMARIARGVDPAIDSAREAAINRATARLLGYLDQEAHTAVLAPDLMTRAMIQQGTKSGTWGGETLRSVMLFKSFAFGIVDKHLRRIQNIPTTQGKVAYSVAMMTSLTLFGAVSVQLKDLAQGKDPRDMTTPKFWTAAFLQGGGVGILGDVFYTGMGGNARGGQANWTSLLGPVFGNAADALDLTLGNVYRAAQEKETQFGADALRFARSNLPFVNLWYLRAATDHLVLHDLQEQVSPGYLRKMKRRQQKEWDAGFWWEPGESAPDRAPDVANAVGGE